MITTAYDTIKCNWCNEDKQPYAKVEKLFVKVDVCSRKCLDYTVNYSKTKIVAVHLNSRQARRDEKKL